MEPLPEGAPEPVEFAREIVGNAIPPSFLPACEKGFREAANSGGLTGHPVHVSPPPPPLCLLATKFQKVLMSTLKPAHL